MSKWVQLRQAQLAKETLRTQQAMLRLQQQEDRWSGLIEVEYPIGREENEGATVQGGAAAAPPPPPPGPDATARVAELEARVASLEARLQWCIDALQRRDG